MRVESLTKLTFAIISILILQLSAKDLYDPMTSNVGIISSKNWSSQMKSTQTNGGIYIVHFYNEEDGQSYEFSKTFIKKSIDLKGIFRMGQVNCTSNAELCKKQFEGKLPAIMVYPPQPIPSKTFVLADVNKAIGFAVRHLTHSVIEINDESYIGFLQSEKTMPKILLLTDKAKGIPLLAKGLSNSFNNKMKFGLIRSSSTEVVDYFEVNTFPSLLIHKQGLKKPLVYKGELKFQKIFDFLNIHSEQFVPKASSSDESENEKTWLYEILPELHADSVDDICVNTTKTLCVILFAKEKPSKKFVNEFKNLKKRFDQQREDALKFKFMWINREKHPQWTHNFGIDTELNVQAVIFNPGRRKRFVKITEEFTIPHLNYTIEKILGGDSRFVPLRSGVPHFSTDL